jgi:hypothetical protein
MIAQCVACRGLGEVEHATVATNGSKVGLRCAACGETTWLPTQRPPLAPPLEPPPAAGVEAKDLGAAFLALKTRWEDRAAHRGLLLRAAGEGALPTLGLRYREVLAQQPDDATAKWAQQEIITLAMASLTPLASRPGPSLAGGTKQRATLFALLVLLGLVLLSLFTRM